MNVYIQVLNTKNGYMKDFNKKIKPFSPIDRPFLVKTGFRTLTPPHGGKGCPFLIHESPRC